MCPQEHLLYIRELSGLSFAIKRIGIPCCTFATIVTCHLLQIILLQIYLPLLLPTLGENTLLETTYHFLLLLVGFDTLTYWKDYNWFPILVGHQRVRSYTPMPSLSFSPPPPLPMTEEEEAKLMRHLIMDSIHIWETMKQISLPAGTPKTHLSRLSRMSYSRRLSKLW